MVLEHGCFALYRILPLSYNNRCVRFVLLEVKRPSARSSETWPQRLARTSHTAWNQVGPEPITQMAMRSFTLLISAAACTITANAQSHSIGSTGDEQFGPNAAAGYAITHFSNEAALLAVSLPFWPLPLIKLRSLSLPLACVELCVC